MQSSGPNDGLACKTATDCMGLEGAGECLEYNLECSYRAEMARADAASPLGDMSQADRASLLSESFVVPSSSSANNASALGAADQSEKLRWDQLGLPPMCDRALFVLSAATTTRTRRVELPAENYSFDEESYAQEHTAEGGMLASACLARRPRTGAGACKQPPASCMRWPGCNVSAWPACEEASSNQSTCTTILTIRSRAYNGSAAAAGGNSSEPILTWVNESVTAPPRSVLEERCARGRVAFGNVTCTRKIVVEYETTLREFAAVPVYSEHVCERYKEQCAACFCVDSIANFWVIWFFSLSPGYSDLCSVQVPVCSSNDGC